MTKEPKSKLGKLQQKFFDSGIKDNPVITNAELKYLLEELGEMVMYMRDRGDSSMSYMFAMERERVSSMMFYRGMIQ